MWLELGHSVSCPSPQEAEKSRSRIVPSACVPFGENLGSWPQQAAREAGKCSFHLSNHVLTTIAVQDGEDRLGRHQLFAANSHAVASPPGEQWGDPTLSHIKYHCYKLLVPCLLLKAHAPSPDGYLDGQWAGGDVWSLRAMAFHPQHSRLCSSGGGCLGYVTSSWLSRRV